ncbi:MAG TPA: hypothetical protein VM689_20330 [Aliidongia sp.]|nr:hypothetical protein [Aliidongia sp.]
MVVAHYCGHRVTPLGRSGPLLGSDEMPVSLALADTLSTLEVSALFGSLSAGAELLIAEAALKRGAELHVVLPFGPLRFKAEAVTPGGVGWDDRFDAAFRRASSVEVLPGEVEATSKAYAMGARRAMDRAVMRARMLGIEPMQIAIWDGRPTADGSTVDDEIKEWQATGLHSCIIPPRWSARRRSM